MKIKLLRCTVLCVCVFKETRRGCLKGGWMVFGPKTEDVPILGKIHNEELHDLYTLPNIIRVIK